MTDDTTTPQDVEESAANSDKGSIEDFIGEPVDYDLDATDDETAEEAN